MNSSTGWLADADVISTYCGDPPRVRYACSATASAGAAVFAGEELLHPSRSPSHRESRRSFITLTRAGDV
jgi:hypothetical protein